MQATPVPQVEPPDPSPLPPELLRAATLLELVPRASAPWRIPPAPPEEESAPAPTQLEVVTPAAAALEEDLPAATELEVDAPAATELEGVAAPTDPERAERGALAPTALEAPEPRAAAVTIVEKAWSARESHEGELLLGLYEVLGVLGEGGMGRVYRVRHRGWGLDLAVKAPLPAVLEVAGGADLFEREAETWVNLGLHPHVVTCHYVRRVDGVPLVFAEYVDGGSLHEAIRMGRLGSLEAVLDVAVQFAWGLHHAHEQGLVHRDVKPANVMLTADGVAKVTDFGLARARPARVVAAAGAAAGQTMTVEGGGGGTPAYVSPEQARGETVSRRSDLWSFALCVLELFLGRRTWNLGLAAPEVMAAFRQDGLVVEGRPRMPAEVAEVVERCLAESPENRPHDLAEVAAVLRGAWEKVAAGPYPRREPRGGTGSADALNNRAVSLVDLGRAAEAAALWQRALQVEAQHAEATYNSTLAAWASATLEDREVVRRIEEACTSHAGSPRAQQLAARVHLALGQAGEASAAIKRATALGGTDDLAAEIEAAAQPLPGPRRTLRGLVGTAAALALTPDGRNVVAGSGSEVRVWDAASGQALRSLTLEGGPLHSLLVLPAGLLLVGAERAAIAAWDLGSARQLRTFERHAGHATAMAAVPGSRIVVAGGSDRTLRFYDTDSGRCLREIVAHDDTVTAVAASATQVASASRDGSVRLWSVADGRLVAKLALPAGRPLAVVLDEAQSRLVVASDDGVVRDFGLQSHEVVRSFVSHAQQVPALALSSDGTLLLSGSADRTVRVFDADGQRLLARAHVDAAVQAVALAPDGSVWVAHGAAVSAVQPAPLALPAPALCRPASATEEEARSGLFESQLAEARRVLGEGNVKTALELARTARSVPGHERAPTAVALWDELSARLPRRGLDSAWEEAVLAQGRESLLAVDIEADGRRVLAASFDGSLELVDVAARRRAPLAGRHEGPVTSVAFAGPRAAVSGGRDRIVRVWDLAGRRAPVVLEGHGETVTSVDARVDGTRAASGSADGTVRLWDVRAGTITRVLEGHRAQVSCVRFSNEGLVVASAGWDGTARLWDAEAGSALGVLEGHETNLTALGLHPAGRQVATGCEDGSIRVFDSVSRRVLRRLEGHRAAVTALAFTADGRFLLSGSRDTTVRAWDLRRGGEIRSLAHPAPVQDLALAASASLLVSAGNDGALRLWRLDWDLDPEGAGNVTAMTSVPLVETVLTRGVPAAARGAALREELRRAAPPVPVQAIPDAVGGAARNWKSILLGLGLVLAVTGSWLVWHKPASRLRLSPSMMRQFRGQPDLIDVRSRAGAGCSGGYQGYLELVRSGNPTSGDIACVAVSGQAGLVADVLDGVPLTDEDPMKALRLQRNAAAALRALEGDAIGPLCERLGDGREEVRLVAGTALGVIADAAAAECVRRTLESGTPDTSASAALALRIRLTQGLTSVEEGWATVQSMLRAAQPVVRSEGLRLLFLFNAGVSLPAAQALLKDPNPSVVETAREAVAQIEGTRKADQLEGDLDS